MTLKTDHIDTREGWHEINVQSEEAHLHAIYQLAEYDRETGALVRAWVRDEALSPLPTEPYTVIRVRWREDEGARNLVRIQAPQESMWQTLTTGPVKYWGSETLLGLITGFEVLAWPADRHDSEFERQRDLMLKRTTAKVVIDRAREHFLYKDAQGYLDGLAQEFGASW